MWQTSSKRHIRKNYPHEIYASVSGRHNRWPRPILPPPLKTFPCKFTVTLCACSALLTRDLEDGYVSYPRRRSVCLHSLDRGIILDEFAHLDYQDLQGNCHFSDGSRSVAPRASEIRSAMVSFLPRNTVQAWPMPSWRVRPSVRHVRGFYQNEKSYLQKIFTIG